MRATPGDVSQAARDLAPIRAFGKPIADLLAKKRYVEQQSMFDTTQPAGMHQYWKSEFLPRLSDEVLRTYRHHGTGIASPMSQAIIFQLGGAITDHDAGDTPFANRDAAYIFFAAGCWSPNDDDAETHLAWARSNWQAICPYSTGGNHINAQTADEDETRLRAAYGDSLSRLAQAKASYDPENLFRVNRNIAPARDPAPGPTAAL